MNRHVLTLILITLSIPLLAEERYPDSVIWGSYCGECVGQCSTFMKIDKDSLQIDNTDRFFQLDPYDPINYSFKGSLAEKSELSKYQWLLSSSIPSILKMKPTIFGEPDAYDQCGYFLSYNIGNENYRALIDPNKVPIDLEKTIDMLFK